MRASAASSRPPSPLHGTWLLVSCTMTLPDDRTLLPYGEQPRGAIQYNPDGWMTCQMAASSEGGDVFETLSAYHGGFSVNEATNCVTHHVAWSSSDRVAGDASRHYHFEGDLLVLTAQSGDAIIEACWRRAC